MRCLARQLDSGNGAVLTVRPKIVVGSTSRWVVSLVISASVSATSAFSSSSVSRNSSTPLLSR